MRFLVGANLPPVLAAWLRERGHAADHVSDTGESSRTDTQIWREAISAGCILVSKNEDFARRRSVSSDGPQVVWIRLGNTRRAALFSHLQRVWPQLELALEHGEPLVEVSSRGSLSPDTKTAAHRCAALQVKHGGSEVSSASPATARR